MGRIKQATRTERYNEFHVFDVEGEARQVVPCTISAYEAAEWGVERLGGRKEGEGLAVAMSIYCAFSDPLFLCCSDPTSAPGRAVAVTTAVHLHGCRTSRHHKYCPGKRSEARNVWLNLDLFLPCETDADEAKWATRRGLKMSTANPSLLF
ncbi:hypothetical protein BaRGS_00012576 [Batillaria attramentaria]|uniref:Uncharacterized protein n=1 Tax=Batillaria attramentaria TaxID=370345 RepID=A0ABD0L9D0_9CAEN